ncbi:MAG: T9SS type A sorting domain-containing protein [candidate division Zixibacteria bacterium]|nr:T9SS type A sorting domain-containing protein [candidate division Zixibacteria bacterium]
MKRAVVILLLLVAVCGPARAELQSFPDYSFLWNSFSSVRVIDTFAVGTTDYGLVVLKLNRTSKIYEPQAHLALNTAPYTIKIDGDMLAVRSESNILYFVDFSNPPEVNLVGTVDPGFEFHDFALKGQNLYLARGFDGLWQYRMTDYENATFIDSSLIGIHVVQCEVEGQHLLALDDYNGLLRYDLSFDDLNSFLDYLWIPIPVEAFTTLDTQVAFIPVDRRLLLLGAYGSGGPRITDSVTLSNYPRQVFARGNYFVALDPAARMLEAVHKTYHSILLAMLPREMALYPDGCTYEYETDDYLLLPTTSGGLVQYVINDLWFNVDYRQVYSRPGPINGMFFDGGRLFTGGSANPLEVYSIDALGRTTRDTAVFGLNNVGTVTNYGNIAFILYPESDNIFVLRFTQSTIIPLATVPVIGWKVENLEFRDNIVDTASVLFSIGAGDVDVFAVLDDWTIAWTSVARVIGTIMDVLIDRDMIIVSSNKFQLSGFRLYDNYTVEHVWTIGTPGKIGHMVNTGARTDHAGNPLPSEYLAFSTSREMYRLVIPETGGEPTFEHITTLPLDVTASTQTDDVLFTIGTDGIGMFDLHQPTPDLIDYGGFGGHLIANDSNWLAVSDGTAIHLYDIEEGIPTDIDQPVSELPLSYHLLHNYPNPFNPTTVIEYSLPRATDVKLTVLNVLGQEVSSLADGFQSPGVHRVTWTGTDDTGRPVSSGMYFYRLTTEEAVETRKMMLVR